MESCKQSQKFSCSRWIDTGKETLDRLAKIAAEKARGTQVETKLLFTAFCIISTPFSFQFLSLCQRLREPDHMKSICQRYHLYLLYLYIICIYAAEYKKGCPEEALQSGAKTALGFCFCRQQL